MGTPCDDGVGGRQLGHDVARDVVAVDPEPRRLALESAESVAVEAGVLGRRITDLRPIEGLRAVADAGDTDRRVYLGLDNRRIERRATSTVALHHVLSPRLATDLAFRD